MNAETLMLGLRVPSPWDAPGVREGAVLELGDDGEDHLFIYLNKLSNDEATAIGRDPIQTAYCAERPC